MKELLNKIRDAVESILGIKKTTNTEIDSTNSQTRTEKVSNLITPINPLADQQDKAIIPSPIKNAQQTVSFEDSKNNSESVDTNKVKEGESVNQIRNDELQNTKLQPKDKYEYLRKKLDERKKTETPSDDPKKIELENRLRELLSNPTNFLRDRISGYAEELKEIEKEEEKNRPLTEEEKNYSQEKLKLLIFKRDNGKIHFFDEGMIEYHCNKLGLNQPEDVLNFDEQEKYWQNKIDLLQDKTDKHSEYKKESYGAQINRSKLRSSLSADELKKFDTNEAVEKFLKEKNFNSNQNSSNLNGDNDDNGPDRSTGMKVKSKDIDDHAEKKRKEYEKELRDRGFNDLMAQHIQMLQRLAEKESREKKKDKDRDLGRDR